MKAKSSKQRCPALCIFNDCYLLMTFFYLCLNAKLKQIALANMKTMMFCSKFIQELVTKIFEAIINCVEN